jgi:hypothetical protein
MFDFFYKPETTNLLILILGVILVFKNNTHIHNKIQFPTTYNHYYHEEKDDLEDDNE